MGSVTGFRVQDDGGSLKRMAEEVAEVNRLKGWYDSDRTFGDDIALLHSECSEALEAYRDHRAEDATRHSHGDGLDCNPEAPCKPEGVGSELADVLVRLLDTADRYNIDLFYEWRRKMDYNWTRPYRHGDRAL